MLTPYIWDLHHNVTINAAFNEYMFEYQHEYLHNEAKNLSERDIIKKVCDGTQGLFGYTYDECYEILDFYLETIHNT